jgi:hypothetical protein
MRPGLRRLRRLDEREGPLPLLLAQLQGATVHPPFVTVHPLSARPLGLDEQGGVTHTAPSKHHDEIISLVFIHTKYGEPIVIMVFRRAIQVVLCLSPPDEHGYRLSRLALLRCIWEPLWAAVETESTARARAQLGASKCPSGATCAAPPAPRYAVSAFLSPP